MFLYTRVASLVRSKKLEPDTYLACPIESIPVEILLLIFEEYCRAWSKTKTCSLPELLLTQVCAYWRALAVQVPTLWTTLTITSQTPSHVVVAYLQRSQQLSLDLEIDLRHDSVDIVKREQALAAWTAVKPSSARWRRLDVQINPHDASFVSEDLQQLGVPRLQELRISSASHVSGITKVFEGGTPSLKSLRLSGMSVQHFGSSLRQLTHLHLTSNCPIHYSVFQPLMSRMTNLQELVLRSRVVEGWPLYPTPEDVINLPSLMVLKLSDRRWPLFIPLLSISAPVLHTLSLYDLVAHDLPEASTEYHLRENLPSVRKLILKGKSSYVDDVSFAQVARIFPAIDHLALLDVDAIFIRESSRIMHQTTIWPKLHTITMTPVVAEDILCSLISARTVPTTKTPLKILVVPVPTRFKKIGWISQQISIEECDDNDTLAFPSSDRADSSTHPFHQRSTSPASVLSV
ncbi:hypothetical protein CPB84DRAFT_1510982 [Gymnopilus junonius]|uniref:F-box domain-containing protein n=1 Tax=Gymnopilus junonius TaxID=109634 RepID=A0A9P5TRG2_GYMJU|nr:hypothetical protein CPB84DRAFT_1510982 [Gymnopilus junonius]